MVDQKRSDEFVPIKDTEGKPFQVDKYGNHRIVVMGNESRWHKIYEFATLKVENKNGTTDVFFAATKFHNGYLPTECILKAVVVDEDGDSGYYRFKIVDRSNDEILEADDVYYILQTSTFEEDHGVSVKVSKNADFVKIKVVKFGDIGNRDTDIVLDRYGVTDYLVGTLNRHDFDIYDPVFGLVNDCTGCDICSEHRYLP